MALSIRLWGGASLGAEHKTVVPALNQGGGILSARAIAWLSQRRGREGSGSKNIGGWSALAIGVALLVSVPIFVVFAYIFVPAGDVWRHLVDTVLGAYVMKELPATLILRPFDFNTLAVYAFELSSDEQLREAAAPALTIVAAGLIPVALLSLAISRARPGWAQAAVRP